MNKDKKKPNEHAWTARDGKVLMLMPESTGTGTSSPEQTCRRRRSLREVRPTTNLDVLAIRQWCGRKREGSRQDGAPETRLGEGSRWPRREKVHWKIGASPFNHYFFSLASIFPNFHCRIVALSMDVGSTVHLKRQQERGHRWPSRKEGRRKIWSKPMEISWKMRSKHILSQLFFSLKK